MQIRAERLADPKGNGPVPVQKIYNLTDHWFPDKIGGSCLYAYKLHKLLSERIPTETITLIGEPSPEEQGMVVHKVLRKASFLHNRRAIRQLASGTDAVWVVHSPWIFLHLFFALGFKVGRSLALDLSAPFLCARI